MDGHTDRYDAYANNLYTFNRSWYTCPDMKLMKLPPTNLDGLAYSDMTLVQITLYTFNGLWYTCPGMTQMKIIIQGLGVDHGNYFFGKIERSRRNMEIEKWK